MTVGGVPDLDRAGLDGLQLTRLRNTLRHVQEHVPHYRRAFADAGVGPEDLHTLTDLGRFPFTTKADLRENYPFGMFAVPREQVVRVHASSGTTGRPTVVGYTQEDVDTWAELMARSIRAAGGRPGDLLHVAYGYGLFTGGLGAHYGAERLGCTVVPVSGGMTERQVQLIVDFGPRVIMVTPSYFLAILDEMDRQGVDPRSTALEVGIFGAEPWTDELRRAVEARSGIRAVDIYGLSEVMGPGVSQEAGETQDGLHVWEDHFLPEVVDPVTLEPVPDGEEGELVLTSLTKQAMPVIRYRTRDLTRLLPGTAYPAFRRMQKVTGRTDDMMIVRGVNVFPSQVEEQILAVDGLAPHYLCVLTRPGSLDELTVQVEAATAAYDAALAGRLAERIKQRIGVTPRVEVLAPHALERSLGKAKRISDRRQ
ncbi:MULTISPECIES: phenylacetate--CoA ligase PaaK [unclassified Nocardioides]|uniref:phenylacetate--CoA ligase PaaK n=1 Tax=unclassified Nocardioides TaxID=2615069 RepID=UPI0009EF9690|nr:MULTISPECIES: phenylacetate--CoA ligase PaaK [unclassified Nocardioides]GAW52134.1 phenylacetate-CoA ligase [Nocardioides sp. PD653-B2]GAW57079.1 phenylacetate-CoA ligase [Nocardioides sp. PD653]